MLRGLQAALANAESRIKALEEQGKAHQKEAEEQQAQRGRLMEEANMLRRAVQVNMLLTTDCHYIFVSHCKQKTLSTHLIDNVRYDKQLVEHMFRSPVIGCVMYHQMCWLQFLEYLQHHLPLLLGGGIMTVLQG